jgi:cytochrome c
MNRPSINFPVCALVMFGAVVLNCIRASNAASLPASVAPEAVRGKIVFEKRCTGCHTLNENRVGPRLAGVYGRKSGTIPNFPYSTALKNAHILWDGKTLEQWLTDPDAFVPDNDMSFHVAKPSERSDVIAYLKTMPAAK